MPCSVGIAQPTNAQSVPAPHQFHGNNTNSDGTPPPAPTLSSPSNNATGVATTITLQWNASSGATAYQVQVSTADDFSSTIFNQSAIAATQVTVSALNANTIYYWKVQASNSYGLSDWSTTRSFTTCTPPPAPALSSPANNTTGVAISLNLQWNASSGAVSYQVQVSTASEFNTTVFNQSGVTATQVTVSPALNANTIYYWRVQASNSAGNSNWSSVWIFATAPPPPPAPALSSPANNATGVATTPSLQWSASSGAASYQVQVSTASNFSATVFDQSSISTTQVAVSPALNANTIYYWRVRASSSSGSSDWSTARTFTTGVVLAAPALSSPANAATGVATTPSLEWSASSGATSYQIQVSTASSFNTTIFNQSGITATQVTVSPALNNSTTYYWRVQASNSAENSNWSTVRSFTTTTGAATPPSAPALSAPANNATGVSTTPSLQWSASSGATSYQIQLSTASSFDTTIFNQSGISATQATVSPALNNSTAYYWRVNASNSSGNSDWSATGSFTTVETIPTVTINTNILGQTGSFNISSAGLLSTATTLSTADGTVRLSLNANTTVTIQGQSLTVSAEVSPPAPPTNANLVNAYNFGPNNTIFSPAITLTLKYDAASLPQDITESNLYIAFWNGSAWAEQPSTVNTQNKTVSTQVTHFTVFAILGRTGSEPPPPPTPPTPPPAGFSISDIEISPASVKAGEKVTIITTVTNSGSSQGSYTVVLKINGANEAEKEVTLKPNKTQVVTFTVSKESAGSYEVAIADKTSSFTVGKSETGSTGSTGKSNWSWLLIGALALGCLIVIVLVVAFIRNIASR